MATPSGRSLQAKLMRNIMVLAAALTLSASYLGRAARPRISWLRCRRMGWRLPAPMPFQPEMR